MAKLIGQATPEQIEAWKKEHGEIYAVTVDGHVAYLKKPSRKILEYYTSLVMDKKPIRANEALLTNCWLGGDEAIKSVDSLFLSASSQLSELIEVKDSEITKL